MTHQSMTYYFHVTLNGTEKVVELPFTAKFVYDESNTPVGCLVNEEMALAFVRNLQGDVIAVVNQEGTALLEYSYDPWGKVTITQNGENLTEQERQIIAVLCPFAYRGYNYDYTTGLYYLQSRYYNPEWGRFLNVDDTNILLASHGETLGANLFSYCNNNPVNKADYTGYWSEDVHSGYYIFDRFAPKLKHPNGKLEQYGTYYWALQSGFSKNNAKIVADACLAIDDLYPAWIITTYNQSWHFNTNHGTSREDSRIVLFTFFFIIADAYIREATTLYNKGYKFLAAFYVGGGLTYLGYALHPMQDYYAHTNEVSKKVTKLGISFWSHLGTKNVDDAQTHYAVVLGPVKEATMATLNYFMNTYREVLQNVGGVTYDGIHVVA